MTAPARGNVNTYLEACILHSRKKSLKNLNGASPKNDENPSRVVSSHLEVHNLLFSTFPRTVSGRYQASLLTARPPPPS